MYNIYHEKEKQGNTFGKNYDVYINMINHTKNREEFNKVKNFYILENPFVLLKDKKFYLGYINYYKRKRNLINLFIEKIKKRKERREKILGRFVNIVKYNLIKKNKPLNETDLYSLEEYNKNNKNIYINDIKNGKWWFSIETITKLIVNKLSYFDSDTYNIVCQDPINPYLNIKLNTGQLISIYEQISKYGRVSKLLMLFRIANFNINMFLKIYNDDILNTSYKYNLDTLHNDSLYTIFHNLFCNNGIYYANIYKLDLGNKKIKNEVIQLIKNCSFTYKNTNRNIRNLRKFIAKYSYIIKRARRHSLDEELNETEEFLTEEEDEELYEEDEELYEEDDEELNEEEEFLREDRAMSIYSDETYINLLEEELDLDGFLDEYNKNNIEKIKAGILGYIIRKKYKKYEESIKIIEGLIKGYNIRRKNDLEECNESLEECNELMKNLMN